MPISNSPQRREEIFQSEPSQSFMAKQKKGMFLPRVAKVHENSEVSKDAKCAKAAADSTTSYIYRARVKVGAKTIGRFPGEQ